MPFDLINCKLKKGVNFMPLSISKQIRTVNRKLFEQLFSGGK